MDIDIKGKVITLKWTNRAQIVFENMTGHSMSMFDSDKPYTESLMAFWAYIVGSNNGKEDISFDDFLDTVDEQPWLLKDFQEWSERAGNEQISLLSKHDREGAKKK